MRSKIFKGTGGVVLSIKVLNIVDIPLRTEFPVFWEFLGISQKFSIMQMTLAN